MIEPTSRISIADSQTSVSCARALTVQGVTLLQVEVNSHTEIDSALEVLRGFRATGRRVVLCDTSSLMVTRQLGRRIVEHGMAEMLVSCGMSGREIAIGARDEGLSLANVVVCRQAAAAAEVLAYRLAPGDTVLLLGTEAKACDQLATALEKRFSTKSLAA